MAGADMTARKLWKSFPYGTKLDYNKGRSAPTIGPPIGWAYRGTRSDGRLLTGKIDYGEQGINWFYRNRDGYRMWK